jgi:hypothetical protein
VECPETLVPTKRIEFCLGDSTLVSSPDSQVTADKNY